MALHYPGVPGTVLYGGMPTPVSGATVATLQLVNTSASTQAANFVTPMFGHAFKQGDVPAGQYPQFALADDTPCPATLWGLTHWSDGSLKWCGAMLRVPASVAGSGSVTISVKNGGSAPAASARATSDLTAADLKVELSVAGDTAGGAWVAALNDAISLGGDITTYGDGPAGKVWRIGGFARRSSTNHGQLYCWHYVAALQDSSGGLLGLRYLGRVIKGFADTTAPGVGTLTATVDVRRGATLIRSMQGVQADGSTLGANIVMPHYTSFFTAGADAVWDYVQGGGSAAADSTLRVVQDKTYIVKSRTVPPYDTSLSPSGMTAVDYRPQGRGNMVYYVPGTGERDDIGVLAAWYVRHLMRQDAAADKNIRVNGLSTGGWRTCVRKRATKHIYPGVDIRPSYAGIGAVGTNEVNTWYWPGVDDIIPGVQADYLWAEEYHTHHRASGGYYPYLITGEPQYLDLVVEQGAQNILSVVGGYGPTEWVTTTPMTNSVLTGRWHSRDNMIAGTIYKGSGIWFREDMARIGGWSMRDIIQATGLYPTTCPYGSETKLYLRDVLESIYAAHQAYRNAFPQTYRDHGLLGMNAPASGYATDTPWAVSYLANALAMDVSLSGSAGAQGFAQHLAKFFAAVTQYGGVGALGSYDLWPWSAESPTGVRIVSMADAVFRLSEATLNFSTATQLFTWSGANIPAAMTNGDKICFRGGTKPFAAATDGARLHVVEASGGSFKLSATPGGAPISITTTGNNPSVYACISNFAPAYSFEGIGGVGSAPDAVQSAMQHLRAVGFTDIESARAAMQTNVNTYGGFVRVNEPKNAVLAAYPV